MMKPNQMVAKYLKALINVLDNPDIKIHFSPS